MVKLKPRSMLPLEDNDDGMGYYINGELLVTRHGLNVQVKNKDQV